MVPLLGGGHADQVGVVGDHHVQVDIVVEITVFILAIFEGGHALNTLRALEVPRTN